MNSCTLVTDASIPFAQILADTAASLGRQVCLADPALSGPPVAAGKSKAPALALGAGSEARTVPWVRSSPLSARSVILACENTGVKIRDAVLIFDGAALAAHGGAFDAAGCASVIDTLIRPYAYLTSALLERFRKQGEGTLTFVFRDIEASHTDIGLAMAAGAFKALAAETARFVQTGVNPAVQSGLYALEGGMDGENAAWIMAKLSAPPSRGAQTRWVRAGSNSLFSLR